MISVIIPALNEESCLEDTLRSVVAAGADTEIIVVDGQSTDATARIASRYGHVVSSSPGRAIQMNRGAEESHGDILLFLHADVLLPPSGLSSIEKQMSDPRVNGGNFDIVYDGGRCVDRIFMLINRCRRPFGIFYGDSGIFVRREVFCKQGGYRLLPLMEDYDFVRRLLRTGETVCLKEALVVSARRWQEHGLFRTMAAWFFLHVFYYLKIPTRFWGRLYPPIRRRVSSELQLETVRTERH